MILDLQSEHQARRVLSGDQKLYQQIAGKLARTLRDPIPVPQTDDELHEWVRTYLNVHIPREHCCAEHVPPFEAFAHAYFARSPICLWLASRGFGGKSFLLALLTLTEAITLGAATSLLGGSGEQSERVHSYIAGTDPNVRGKFWDAPRAPRGLIKTDPTKREMHLTNSAVVKALMASSRSVRGPHPQRLRLDECDEMDIRIFDAAMGQTMKARGIEPQTVCSSTHHNPDGTMTELLKRSREKGWPVFEWCYRENLEPHGWLEQSEVDRKRGEVSATMWKIEYEMQRPSPKDRAIDTGAVKRLFNRDLGEFDGAAGAAGEVVIVQPFHLREFYHGTDWAKSQDWTILHTMERREHGPDRLAAWARHGRKPWPLMIDAHNRRVRRYGGPSAHDVTGVGDVADDFLTVDSTPVDFRDRKKISNMLQSYVVAIEAGDLEYPYIEWAYYEHLYATNVDLYRPSGHLPDTIAAAALAWYAREYGDYPYDPSEVKTVA